MIDKATFKKTIFAPFKANGFTRKGDSWYISSEEVVAVVNFQKSDWGERYFINVGFWLSGIEYCEFPKTNYCHIFGRLSSLYPAFRDQIDCGCALTEELGHTPEDFAWIVEFISRELIPFCKNNLTELTLKVFCSGTLKETCMLKPDGEKRLCAK